MTAYELSKCPVCGTEYDVDSLVEPCPYCDWIYDFTNEPGEDPDEVDVNPVSFNQALELVKQGKNIWGDPLPDK